MADINEDFEAFLGRVASKIGPRLVRLNGEQDSLLARIRMAACFRAALEREIERLILYGHADDLALLDEILGVADPEPAGLPTWKEIGQALGVSAQAAHRKYGHKRRPANG